MGAGGDHGTRREPCLPDRGHLAGPTADVDPSGAEAKWRHLQRAVTAIPSGRWTSYSDLAALVGTAPQPLGNHLATVPIDGPHRVLKAGGWISDSSCGSRKAGTTTHATC